MSNEDYKKLRESGGNEFNILYNYFLHSGGKQVTPPQFMIKFQEWCLRNRLDTSQVINNLDIKHTYQYVER